MNTLNSSTETTDQVISLIINFWTARNKAVSDFFGQYDERSYQKEVAPGRNRAIYLFGHLIAANDGMMPLFGFGERLYPQLNEIFQQKPDKAVTALPSLAELKEQWIQVNKTLTEKFNNMSASDWLDRHTSVSPEDFIKEPHRNKLNAFIGRTNHMSYHYGQLNLLTV